MKCYSDHWLRVVVNIKLDNQQCMSLRCETGRELCESHSCFGQLSGESEIRRLKLFEKATYFAYNLEQLNYILSIKNYLST